MSGSHGGAPANADAQLGAWSRRVGLDIPAEYQAEVAAQFAALLVQASLVLELPLADEIEPAAVFTP